MGRLSGPPRRRHRAHELDVAFGENAIVISDAVLEVQIPKASPVARRRELVALCQEVPEGVCFHHYRADADLVKQRTLGERQVLFTPFLDAKTRQVVDQHRVGVVIAPDRAGRPLERPRGLRSGRN